MQVKYGGKYIVLETEEDWDKMLVHPELICTCGHHLSDHEYHFLPGSTTTIEVTYCLMSNHCHQFKRRSKEPLRFTYA